ncbi:hypothetical protein GQX74_002347 [Glossina fuscipes]|nr:hypothetical protein GQX74_002347 [Glossina fuscipes]
MMKKTCSKVELFVPPPDEGHVVVSNTVVDSVSDTLACVRPVFELPSRSVTDDVSDTKESPIVVPELGFKFATAGWLLAFGQIDASVILLLVELETPEHSVEAKEFSLS